MLRKVKHIKKITPYGGINKVLDDFVNEVSILLGENIIGIYLFGSLTYDAFNQGRSDIDLLVIVKKPLSKEKLELVKKLHEEIERKHTKWVKRIECSYSPLGFFENILPPKQPRPYYGAGIFFLEASYGNEWIINNYLLYNKGITLKGLDFKTLVKPIDIKDVQNANISDLYKEWVPKIKEPEWKNLIETAESWHYGVEMKEQDEAIRFIKFVVKEIKSNNINN